MMVTGARRQRLLVWHEFIGQSSRILQSRSLSEGGGGEPFREGRCRTAGRGTRSVSGWSLVLADPTGERISMC